MGELELTRGIVHGSEPWNPTARKVKHSADARVLAKGILATGAMAGPRSTIGRPQKVVKQSPESARLSVRLEVCFH